eukprot:CAMPEP_0170503834 /NCGR_PEP_ID=MMETSP0208-20121228/46055_1 /TAXON_ID=197538 /ORGANISM="Strombidium inclinatum, Strain S3" /LENGTH=42 /DNA_ID= /DNA_START= /DNA_END= /DNA_ORIENTATION=
MSQPARMDGFFGKSLAEQAKEDHAVSEIAGNMSELLNSIRGD